VLTVFSVLAQLQLVLVLFQVWAAVLVLLVVDLVVDLLPVEDSRVDHALLLATSAVAPTISLEIVCLPKTMAFEWGLMLLSLRPGTSHEVLCLRQARPHLQRLHCP
jgi:hypothetical protein